VVLKNNVAKLTVEKACSLGSEKTVPMNTKPTEIVPPEKIAQVDTVESTQRKFYSDIIDRNGGEIPTIYNVSPIIKSVPACLEMDFSRIINKPFLVKNIEWKASNAIFSRIETIKIPGDILTSELLKVPFRSSTWFRAKICAFVQVSGTSMHSGIVLASAIPPSTGIPGTRYYVNNYLSAPHMFLTPAMSSASCLEIPFYSNTDLFLANSDTDAPTYCSGNDYAELTFVVLNALAVPTSGTTTINITVHVMFKELEFYVPAITPTWVAPQFGPFASIATKAIDGAFNVARSYTSDFFDWFRSSIKAYTGLHNVNVPFIKQRTIVGPRNFPNAVDMHSNFEKLDPYACFDRVALEPIFETSTDEMLISNIIQRPYYIGNFDLTSSTKAGAILWSRPITPKQEILAANTGETTDLYLTHPLQRIAEMAKYWRGGLKLTLQANMTNFHFAKLSVVRLYKCDKEMLMKVPDYDDVQGLMTETLEFSGGGQIQTIDLPYASGMKQLPIAVSFEENALQHGMYYIYATHPIVSNGTVPTSISFNVYVSAADDFEFYGYAHRLMQDFSIDSAPTAAIMQEEEVEVQSSKVPMTVSVPVELQSPSNNEVNTTSFTDDFRPLVHLRDVVRRMYSNSVITLVGSKCTNKLVSSFDVAGLLGLKNYANISSSTPISEVSRMFHGFNGGMKFKFKIYGAADAKITYVPPGYAYDGTLGNFTQTKPFITGTGATEFNAAGNGRTCITNSSIPHPLPFIEESSSFRISPSDSNMGEAPGADKYLHASSVEIEGVIPFMNHMRFIGDRAQAFNAAKDTSPPATLAMGHLLLATCPFRSVNDSPANSNIYIQIYVGCTDESRFGFNVRSYPSIYPTIQATTIRVFDTLYGNPDGIAHSSARVNYLAVAPAAYIGDVP
jgi:hypothetical protein